MAYGETPVWVEDWDGGQLEAVLVGHELVLCPIVRYTRKPSTNAALESVGVNPADIPLSTETVHPRDVSPRQEDGE